jgi:GNAT superfamily N-acetyltransferase
MFVVEINTRNHKQANQFLNFPFFVYKSSKQWVPMLEMDAKKLLDRDHFSYYKESDAGFFMVFSENGQPLGRIAVLDNQRYNRFNHSNVAFFYLFEVLENFEAAKMLFDSAVGWARDRGLSEIIGPKGFTPLNGLGMLTRGFEHRPALGIPYNLPYYPEYLEKIGFKVDREVVSGYLGRQHELPEKVALIAERVQQRWGLTVKRFEKRTDLRRMLPYLKGLYNGSLVGTSGNAPLTDEEVREMANQILWFANPHLIKILYKEEQPVGFLLAYPDISAAIQKSKGKLWPFGWISMLSEFKKTNWININGAGIIAEYRGLGGTALLFNEMAESVRGGPYEHADLVQIGLENEKMQREVSAIGIDFYKSHCIYQRDI